MVHPSPIRKPVSYTHLDVYKRQGLLHRGQHHARNIHVVGPAHGPYDDIGNIFRNQRLDALVDLGRSLLVLSLIHI